MPTAPDDRMIELPCPGCGNPLAESIGWFRANKAIDCPACGSTLDLSGAGFRQQLDAAAKAAGDGRVAFKGLSIRNR